MAEEPENLTHVMLREQRGKLDAIEARLNGLDEKLGKYRQEVVSLARSVTIALGQSTRTQYDLDDERARIDELFEKIEKLLTEQPPSH